MGKAGKKNTQLPPTIELRPQPYLTLKPSLVEDEDGFPVVNDKTKGPRLSGKEWVPIAYRRRADELHPDLVNITTASSQLATESETAADCVKPLEARYIEKELRKLNIWPKKPRGSPKQPQNSRRSAAHIRRT